MKRDHGPGVNEHLYWSSDPADVEELRLLCRVSFQSRQRYGAGIMPLLGSEVMFNRAGEVGRVLQVFAEHVFLVASQGTPLARGVTIHPSEVLLPWIEDHQPAFTRSGRRHHSSPPATSSPARAPSARPSLPSSGPSLAAAPARPMDLLPEAPAGQTSLL